MLKRLAGLGLAFCLLAPQARAAPDPVVWHSVAVCDPNAPNRCISLSPSTIPINISTATTTTLVAGTSGQSILVTHWNVVAGGTGNFQLEYGTGGCAANLVAITGPYPLAAQAGLVAGNGQGVVVAVPAGDDLCAVTTSTQQMSGSLTYTKN